MDNIRITIETNADEAAKTFENLSNAFNSADTGARDLRKDIKDLKAEIYKMTPGTEEYAQALVKLGDKMNTLGDIQRDLKASTGGLDTVFQTTAKATSTMASGFQAAMGMVTLFGGETKELQQTFIKLQAVMAIAQGLNGFSGFVKYTQTASASLKAFINKLTLSTNAVKSDTNAKAKDVVVTKSLDGAQKTAAASTNLLTTSFKKLKAAMASNPIGLIIIALTTLIGLVTRYNSKAEEEAEFENRLNTALGRKGKTLNDTKAYYDQLDAEHEHYLERLAAMGTAQEEINKQDEEWLKEQKEIHEAYVTKYEDLYKNINYANQLLLLKRTDLAETYKGTKAMEEFKKAYEGHLAKLEEYAPALEKAIAKKDPFSYYTERMKEAMKQMELLAEEGLMSAEDILNERIRLTRLQIGKLSSFRGSETDEEKKLRQQKIRDLQAEIEDYEFEIKKIQAGHRKKFREETQKTIAEYEKNFQGLKQAITGDYQDLIDDIKKEIERISGTDIPGMDQVSNVMLRLREAQRAGMTKEKLDEFEKDIQSALEKKDITEKQAAELRQYINDLGVQYKGILSDFVNKLIDPENKNYKYFDNIHDFPFDKLQEIFTPFNSKIDAFQQEVQGFYKRIADAKTALDNAEITPEQYYEAIARIMEDSKTMINSSMEMIPKYVEEGIKGIEGFDGMTSEQQQAIRDMLTKYLTDALYIPQSEYDAIVAQIKDNVDDILDKTLDAIDAEYDHKKAEIENRGHNQTLMQALLGSWFGDDPIMGAQAAKQRINDLFKIYEDSYKKEEEALLKSMSSLEASGLKDTDEYRQYYSDLIALRDKYNAEMKNRIDKLAEQTRAEVEGTIKNVGTIASALSNFGSYMAEYYQDMADNEAKNEDEKRKYTLQGLNMQKFSAIATIASGIASAIANAMSLGPIAGPIVGAIEAAAVAASGAIQIKQINRQIQELGGSAGNSDTPTAAGMVDRIITANAQNTDQREQLNAQYGSADDRRVYITQSDIDNGRKTRSVAVTQNGF